MVGERQDPNKTRIEVNTYNSNRTTKLIKATEKTKYSTDEKVKVHTRQQTTK